jgi:hypothetical protein
MDTNELILNAIEHVSTAMYLLSDAQSQLGSSLINNDSEDKRRMLKVLLIQSSHLCTVKSFLNTITEVNNNDDV